MLVLARNLVLSEPASAAIPPGTPLIGWHNLITFGNVSADTEAQGYPVTNIVNPSTAVEWRGNDTTAQEVTAEIASVEDVDYVGIARHNFASAAIAVSIGYYDGLGAWVELIAPLIPPDDSPLLFRFEPLSLASLVIRMASGTAAPRIAVAYAGRILTMERGVVVDQDFPVPRESRRTEVVNGRAASGNYLGRIVTGQYIEWYAKFAHLRPDWYRENFEPFVEAAQDDRPFFYVRAPLDDPREVTFAYLTDDPMPLTSPVTGRKTVELKCSGIVR